jgi:hypothetical protein
VLRRSGRYRLTLVLLIEVTYSFLIRGPRTFVEIFVDEREGFALPDLAARARICESHFVSVVSSATTVGSWLSRA